MSKSSAKSLVAPAMQSAAAASSCGRRTQQGETEALGARGHEIKETIAQLTPTPSADHQQHQMQQRHQPTASMGGPDRHQLDQHSQNLDPSFVRTTGHVVDGLDDVTGYTEDLPVAEALLDHVKVSESAETKALEGQTKEVTEIVFLLELGASFL
ncbi:hypothetical protein CONLIGDRAFT_720006 [Coniochaeta ligniaria NRRL 30616]|uniref:Uncharacterized protein n=1 Tax=Coniochaeta ligniaria NRRL 30616 TaxID=1408157 RepID=A0A1J7IMB8_9PEZI|nr:hypothetical protein CONLIGDRAFT_720006 [Coniochaeta ligniaria NRRL 30616]